MSQGPHRFDAPHGSALRDLELRVLDGAQGGARTALQAGVACVLAAEPEGQPGADIVLREEGVTPTRVRVTADLPHGRLEVLQGEVELAGKKLAAGTEAAWPMHAPLQIGASVVAFGPAGAGEWPRVAAADEAEASSALQGRDAPVAAPRRRLDLWLGAAGAFVALASAAVLVFAHVAAAPVVTPTEALQAFEAALGESEFKTLQLARDAEGQPALRGRLATLAERNRLEQWLAAQPVAPRLEVSVEEQLARDVTDVFRVNGVAVTARPAGAGRIVAEASDSDHARVARAEEVVHRDVRGLVALELHNSAAAPEPPEPPVVDDPGKRIASVVPGEPAYLVTVDGARYFIGALLPSGHRITRIAGGVVTLERNGRPVSLSF